MNNNSNNKNQSQNIQGMLNSFLGKSVQSGDDIKKLIGSLSEDDITKIATLMKNQDLQKIANSIIESQKSKEKQ